MSGKGDVPAASASRVVSPGPRFVRAPGTCARVAPRRRPRRHRGIGWTARSSILRTKFEFSHGTAVLTIHQDGSDLFRAVVEFLAPLPQSDKNRKDPTPLRRQHIFLIGAAV